MGRRRSFVGWRTFSTKTAIAGFTLGKSGMSSWPTPLPISLLFDRAPSGFTTASGLITSWVDQGQQYNLTASGAQRPTLGSLNGIPSPDFTPNNHLRQGSNPFGAKTKGEVWFVVQSDDWRRGGLGTVLLSVLNTSTSKELLFRVYGDAPPYSAANRLALNTYDPAAVPTGDSAYGSTALSNGTVYVVRYVSTGSAWELWLNGAQETLTFDLGSNHGKWFNHTAATDLRLGSYDGSSYSFDGRMPFHMVLEDVLGTGEARQWAKFLCRAFGATFAG